MPLPLDHLTAKHSSSDCRLRLGARFLNRSSDRRTLVGWIDSWVLASPSLRGRPAPFLAPRGGLHSARLLRWAIKNSLVLHKSLPIRHPSPVNLFIPKSNYLIAPFSEIGRSCGVKPFLCLLSMLVAVEFDDQASFDATKVGKVRTNPMLSAELETTEALRSKLRPQYPLLGRRRREDVTLDLLDFHRQHS